jgi:hypothetical protein
MAYAHPSHAGRSRHRRGGHNPLFWPVIVFAVVCVAAALYVAYVLWPRWPDVPVAVDAPSMPIVVAGTPFNIQPAAIRIPVQRRTGSQSRVDLAYLWPSLIPPDPSVKVIDGAPVDPNERMFLTIQAGDGTLPLADRLKNIYPRYMEKEPAVGPDGLTVRPFSDGSPYQGEDLIIETDAAEHFTARCSRKGVSNTGTCLLERRIGNADLTFRFPRDWLNDWKSVAAGIDKLLARLAPN